MVEILCNPPFGVLDPAPHVPHLYIRPPGVHIDRGHIRGMVFIPEVVNNSVCTTKSIFFRLCAPEAGGPLLIIESSDFDDGKFRHRKPWRRLRGKRPRDPSPLSAPHWEETFQKGISVLFRSSAVGKRPRGPSPQEFSGSKITQQKGWLRSPFVSKRGFPPFAMSPINSRLGGIWIFLSSERNCW